MPGTTFEELQRKQQDLVRTVTAVARRNVQVPPGDSLGDGELAGVASSPLKGRQLFMSARKPDARVDDAASANEGEPVQAYNHGDSKFRQLQSFLIGLRMIGANYTGSNPKRKDVIARIQETANNPLVGANHREKLINLAQNMHALLTEVTRDHYSGFTGFFAYLFGKKCRLEKLILDCFKPLVLAKILTVNKNELCITKAPEEAVSNAATPSLRS